MRFHNIVQPIMFKDDVQVVPPENIYNVNESGYTVCNKPQKVVTRKGKKSIETLSSAECGKTVTAVCCVNAMSMLVFPRVRFKPELIDKAPNGSIGAASKTGLINESVFNKWFAHFVKSTNPIGRDAPVIHIMGSFYGNWLFRVPGNLKNQFHGWKIFNYLSVISNF